MRDRNPHTHMRKMPMRGRDSARKGDALPKSAGQETLQACIFVPANLPEKKHVVRVLKAGPAASVGPAVHGNLRNPWKIQVSTCKFVSIFIQYFVHYSQNIHRHSILRVL